MLLDQYRLLEREYNRYSSGEISKEEYLRRAKPIDETIASMEMAALGHLKLAKTYHPDIGGDELMFKAIVNIKQYLMDKTAQANGNALPVQEIEMMRDPFQQRALMTYLA